MSPLFGYRHFLALCWLHKKITSILTVYFHPGVTVCYIFSTYDWSAIYGTSSADAVYVNHNAIVQDATEQAIPRSFMIKSKSPHWFSSYFWIAL
jgi:hypothetical protein